MVSEQTKPVYDLEATRAAISRRRVAVGEAISSVIPEMRDEQARADAFSVAEKIALRYLFDKGYTDTAPGVNADLVEWFIDRQLWCRFEFRIGRPFPFENEQPRLHGGPRSAKFLAYQEARLASESAQSVKTSRPQSEERRQETNVPGPSGKSNPLRTGQGPAVPTSAGQKRKSGPGAEESAVASIDRDMKRTRLAPPTSTENTPAASSDEEAEDMALSQRFELLLTKDYPPDRPAWSKFIWDALFPHLPRQDGVYFAVPVRDEWTPFVSPDVLRRANITIQSPAWIEVREPAEAGKLKLVVVALFDSAEPTNRHHLFALVCAWSRVQEWHQHMVGGLGYCPMDEFIWTRIFPRGMRDANAAIRHS
ncbi:hypothetical protein C8A01DRAFT_42026 [Parachaetomium inaequale]|uniref:Uncharacterized protein n=1 Tax=Parachaetomium inaequale TaxID=2588326 RepID=A0AAN6SKB3_9PEZI|nr:hypothetical protein C8A01DRAFT_42026 [Parachaetomium inaequale]